MKMNNEWTREKVEETFKDKNIHLVFNRYYKYAFTFTGLHEQWEDDPRKLVRYKFICKNGGNKDDIYRYEVCMDKPVSLLPLTHWGNNIEIKRSEEYDKWETVYDEYTYF